MGKRRSGVTIMGLFVTLALVSGLAVLLHSLLYVCVFKKNQAKRNMNWCQSNLKQLSAAMLAYADDWHGRLPAWLLPNDQGVVELSWDRARTWDRVVLPYVPNGEENVITCPEHRFAGRQPVRGWPRYRSYSYPGQLGGGWEPFRPVSKYLSQIPAPKRTVVLAEIVQAYALATWHGCAVMGSFGGTGKEMGDTDWQRHDGFSNFAYVDGHVQAFTKSSFRLPGYTYDSKGRTLCYINDPLPRP